MSITNKGRRKKVAYVSGRFLSRTQITPTLATLLTNNIQHYRTTRPNNQTATFAWQQPYTLHIEISYSKT